MWSAILFVLTLIHLHASAQDLISVDESNDGFRVDAAYLYNDSTLKMTVKEVAALPETTWRKELLAKYSKPVEWIRVPFVNETSEDIVKVLYLSNPTATSWIFFYPKCRINQTVYTIWSGSFKGLQAVQRSGLSVSSLVTFPANTELFVLIRVHDPLSSVQVHSATVPNCVSLGRVCSHLI